MTALSFFSSPADFLAEAGDFLALDPVVNTVVASVTDRMVAQDAAGLAHAAALPRWWVVTCCRCPKKRRAPSASPSPHAARSSAGSTASWTVRWPVPRVIPAIEAAPAGSMPIRGSSNAPG